ncbi:MAG TPA: DUF1549 domain-containing protein [Isosphaeraceae bacterium]|nr:DUF1549 domain-containing protein [Isosphaeraceae bacterium]
MWRKGRPGSSGPSLTVVWLWLGFGAATARGEATAPALSLEPARVVLEGAAARQQLAVTFRHEDGSPRDVTRECRFVIEPAGIATVTSDGVVHPVADGRATLTVIGRGGSARAAVRVVDAARHRAVSFRADVVPLLAKAGCNMGACHGNLNGKGGFRLSLRGDDPDFDFQSLTHDQFGRRLSTVAPERSLIVLKPTARIPHEGGQRFARQSSEAATLLGWIAAGARDDRAVAPRVQSLRVFPADRIAAPGTTDQQLVVTAQFEDGSTRDVTRQAAYDLSDPTRAEVSVGGLVHHRGPGEIAVAIRYENRRATSRLAFPADRPGFVWRGGRGEHPIDRAVLAKLRALRINPAGLTDDSTFLRRAYLDAIGRLPEPAESRAFLADGDPAKRSKLIDRLVDRPEFADFWALKWADLLRNEEKTMGEKGAWVFQRWLRDQLARDLPLEAMVRRIVAGLGSTWQNPPASFYRTNRDPMTAAESVGQVFLGIRLQCARCHNHPFDVWTQDDYYGLAAFFANIARKQLDNVRKDRLDSHEINGDEVIYLTGRPRLVQPRTGIVLQPRVLQGAPTAATRDDQALTALADWLTRSNRQFTRNLANRVWFHLFGRGIVEPVDDFRDSNPPSNPELLEIVTDRFEAQGTRLKPLVTWIMKSRTYQSSATPEPSNVDDESSFSHAAVRLLPAEVLLDAISQVLDVPERFPHAPGSLRAAQLPGAAKGVSFLTTFGKPERLLTCECERSEATTLAQAFQMINGPTVRRKLDAPDNRLGRRLAAGSSDRELLDELYLAALCRKPKPAEQTALVDYLRRARNRRAAWEDVVWALLNSKEFLLRH